MAKTLQQLIDAAKQALEGLQEGTPEHAAAKARLEALETVQAEGITKTQDDLNHLDRQNKEAHEKAIKDVLGMSLEEAQNVIANFSEESGEGEEGEGEGETSNPLERMQSTVEQLQNENQQLKDQTIDFQRRYYTGQATNRLNSAFKDLGLQDKYYGPAQDLAKYDELIEKMMRGEEVSDDDFKAAAETVKEQAGAFFEAERNNEFRDVPPTPNNQPPQKLTDEQKAQRATPVF